MIHVCFGLHDKTGRYAKFTGTAMLSLFENTNALPQSITVHILHDNTLTPDNRDKFIYLVGQYNQLVKFYNVEELCTDKVLKMVNLIPSVKTSRLSVAALYRLLIPQVLTSDIETVIYLDSDIIVNLDINELWRINLEDKPLGAIPEIFASPVYHKEYAPRKYLVKNNLVNYEDYFNSGVLLMNLDYLRNAEELILSGTKFCGKHPECSCLDQDILNYLFSKEYLKLSAKFDRFVIDERLTERKSQVHRAIYHYIRNSIQLDMNDTFSRLWMKYFMKTPFFDEDTIGTLYANVKQMRIKLKNSMINVSAVMSGKKRTFFIFPQNVEAIKKFFLIRDDEEVILADNKNSLKKLIDAMKLSQGKKVFFIMLPNFPFEILIQEGFAFGRDFLNGFEFLSDVNGVQLDSYPLIQAM